MWEGKSHSDSKENGPENACYFISKTDRSIYMYICMLQRVHFGHVFTTGCVQTLKSNLVGSVHDKLFNTSIFHISYERDWN